MELKNLKLLVLGDLHGQIPDLLIDLNEIDAIFCSGDVYEDNTKQYWKKLFKKKAETGDDNLGFEDFCSIDEAEKLMKLSQKKGREVLEYLNSLNKPVFLVPGNWDDSKFENGVKNEGSTWDETKGGLKNIFDVENVSINFEGFTIIGHGSTSVPENIERVDISFFKKIEKNLVSLFSKTNLPTILISHNSPYGTNLDIIRNKDCPNIDGLHNGSTIAKSLIEKFNPVLAISGHIHEGYGKDKVGNTICINAGYGGKVNTIVEIDKQKNEIVDIVFLGKNKEN